MDDPNCAEIRAALFSQLRILGPIQVVIRRPLVNAYRPAPQTEGQRQGFAVPMTVQRQEIEPIRFFVTWRVAPLQQDRLYQ